MKALVLIEGLVALLLRQESDIGDAVNFGRQAHRRRLQGGQEGLHMLLLKLVGQVAQLHVEKILNLLLNHRLVRRFPDDTVGIFIFLFPALLLLVFPALFVILLVLTLILANKLCDGITGPGFPAVSLVDSEELLELGIILELIQGRLQCRFLFFGLFLPLFLGCRLVLLLWFGIEGVPTPCLCIMLQKLQKLQIT